MSKLLPLSDHLVVEPMPKETQTASGFYIPDTKESKPESGTVIAVGPGRKNDDGTILAIDLQVGDKVMFKKYAPDEFEIDGKKLLVLRESDVIAKLVD